MPTDWKVRTNKNSHVQNNVVCIHSLAEKDYQCESLYFFSRLLTCVCVCSFVRLSIVVIVVAIAVVVVVFMIIAKWPSICPAYERQFFLFFYLSTYVHSYVNFHCLIISFCRFRKRVSETIESVWASTKYLLNEWAYVEGKSKMRKIQRNS